MVVCVYLVKSHLSVYGGGVTEGLFCGGAGLFDCDQVAAHESSWLLELPVAVWGLLFYVCLLGVSLCALLLRGGERKAFVTLGTTACTLALLYDLYLLFVMVAQIGTICLNCVATHVLNLLLLLSFWKLNRDLEEPVRWSRILPSWRLLRHGTDTDYYRALFQSGLMGVTLTVAAICLVTVLEPLREIRTYGQNEVADFTRRMASAPEIDMVRFDRHPSQGPTSAAVNVVLIGDFQCSFCRSLANTVEDLRREYPEDIRVVFVHSPLSSECNEAIPGNFHPDACWLAKAGVCAEAQGKFWDFHDYLFQEIPNRSVGKQSTLTKLTDIGLDEGEFLACMEGNGPTDRVAGDIALCSELGLTVTPSIVINGYAKRGSVFPWMLTQIVTGILSEDDGNSDPEPPPSSGGKSRRKETGHT